MSIYQRSAAVGTVVLHSQALVGGQAKHSCSMAWSSSIPEPSPKLAPQQQTKPSPSAGFPQTLCSQAVLSKDGCSRGAFPAEAVIVVTSLSCSLSIHLLLCAVRSWYARWCCATKGLRVCYVPPPPLCLLVCACIKV